MAIRPCKECGKNISTKAEVCPHCGAKPKRTSAFTWIITIFIILVGFSLMRASLYRDERAAGLAQKAAALTPEQRAAEAKIAAERKAVEKRANDEGTMAYQCKEWVRKSLHDPDSAKFEDNFAISHTQAYDRVQVKVRARNAFNAIRMSTFECRIARKDGYLNLLGMNEIH